MKLNKYFWTLSPVPKKWRLWTGQTRECWYFPIFSDPSPPLHMYFMDDRLSNKLQYKKCMSSSIIWWSVDNYLTIIRRMVLPPGSCSGSRHRQHIMQLPQTVNLLSEISADLRTLLLELARLDKLDWMQIYVLQTYLCCVFFKMTIMNMPMIGQELHLLSLLATGLADQWSRSTCQKWRLMGQAGAQWLGSMGAALT
jgi:hypothetical protein